MEMSGVEACWGGVAGFDWARTGKLSKASAAKRIRIEGLPSCGPQEELLAR
jgi:hypothetical protein